MFMMISSSRDRLYTIYMHCSYCYCSRPIFSVYIFVWQIKERSACGRSLYFLRKKKCFFSFIHTEKFPNGCLKLFLHRKIVGFFFRFVRVLCALKNFCFFALFCSMLLLLLFCSFIHCVHFDVNGIKN